MVIGRQHSSSGCARCASTGRPRQARVRVLPRQPQPNPSRLQPEHGPCPSARAGDGRPAREARAQPDPAAPQAPREQDLGERAGRKQAAGVVQPIAPGQRQLLYCTHTAQASENTTANAWDRLMPAPSAPFTLTTQIKARRHVPERRHWPTSRPRILPLFESPRLF